MKSILGSGDNNFSRCLSNESWPSILNININEEKTINHMY